MKSIERVFTALQHEEADKVPIFLLLTVHGAKELNLSYTEYFMAKKGDFVAEAQIRLQEKYGYDALYPFFYAAKESEMFGGKALAKQNGPPESGRPIFRSIEDILSTELPSIENDATKPIIEAQTILYDKKGDELPILNAFSDAIFFSRASITPASLPVIVSPLVSRFHYFSDSCTRNLCW